METAFYQKTTHHQCPAGTPYELAYVEGNLLGDYIHDMDTVQDSVEQDRQTMADEIVKGMKLDAEDCFFTVHNYINLKDRIRRKGAVSAKAVERLIIPRNILDGYLLCVGRENPDWNYSAPHGAVRLMSQAEARQRYTLSRYKKEMEKWKIPTLPLSAGKLWMRILWLGDHFESDWPRGGGKGAIDTGLQS